jgi:hypothetical protein
MGRSFLGHSPTWRRGPGPVLEAAVSYLAKKRCARGASNQGPATCFKSLLPPDYALVRVYKETIRLLTGVPICHYVNRFSQLPFCDLHGSPVLIFPAAICASAIGRQVTAHNDAGVCRRPLDRCKENGPRAIWLSKFWCLMIDTICGLMCLLVFIIVVHRMR